MPQQAPELRDIHVPNVSPWWPLAPGWWALLVLLLAAIGILVVIWRRRAAQRRHVRLTLADLHEAARRHAVDGDDAAFAAAAHQWLRRVARRRDPRSVTLRGAAWRELLASMAPQQDVSRLASLDEALYRPVVSLDVAAVVTDAKGWLRGATRRVSARERRGRSTHASA